jgi:hypothetical protein
MAVYMAAHTAVVRHSRLRKVLLIIAAAVLAMFSAATAYTWRYSMGLARSVEIAGSASGPNVLIATQGSKFKDAVTNGLLEQLHKQSAHVRVIDVTALPDINEADWDALVVIHTWEMRKPPVAVQTFIDRVQHRDKLVVLTTSGAGDFKLPGVDALSTASKMTDVSARGDEVARRVDALLAARGKSAAQ